MQLNKKDILFNQDSVSKEEAIKIVGNKLFECCYVQEEYILAMLEKEKTDQTYIGNGIAIPHGTQESFKYVIEPGFAVAHFPNGVNYNGETAYILIGIASINNSHLEVLQDLAIKFMDIEYVNKLVSSQSFDEFYNLINSY